MLDEILSNVPENIDAGVFVLDHNGKVIYANSSAVRLMGRPKSYILNYSTQQAFEEGLLDTHIFQLVLKSKKQVTRFQSYCKEDAAFSRPLLVTQTPVLDNNSNLKYSVGIIQDIDYLMRKAESARQEQISTCVITTPKPVAANNFIYASDTMVQLIQRVDQVAQSSATILIQGESGTGKEVMAQYIHQQSPRREKELVAVNCAALPENLLEAELFGYEKGAFTGALRDGKPGLAELADGGTLFLDEIDSLPMSLQGKLLRMLESGEVRRLGSVKSKKVDFRLLAATNADLHSRIRDKQFRVDLFYRINVVPVVIPPLRERKADIRLLCEAFLARYEQKYDLRKSFSPHAYETILAYDWPGNVRELKNFVERMVLVTDVTVSDIDHISHELLPDSPDFSDGPFLAPADDWTAPSLLPPTYDGVQPLKAAVHAYEQWVIEQAVQTHGSYSKAASALGIDKTTLIRKKR